MKAKREVVQRVVNNVHRQLSNLNSEVESFLETMETENSVEGVMRLKKFIYVVG